MPPPHAQPRPTVSPGVSAFDGLLQRHAPALTRRLAGIVGEPHLAEDLCQETLLRAWRRAPRELAPEALGAWLHRTATRLAVDELRRRGRRPELALEAAQAAAGAPEAPDADAALALAALSPHQRLVLLLRFQAGLDLRELGALLDVGPDAARKRVARARGAFAAALREVRAEDERPTVLLLMADDAAAPYEAWLRRAGARVRVAGADRPGLDLAGADALVLSGSRSDLHPRLYGAAVEPRTVRPQLRRDARDLQALRAALACDLPVVGVCRGAQLLSVLLGGDLEQHVEAHGENRPHALATVRGSAVHGALGPAPEVVSDHHQAVRRLGRGLRITARAPDGLAEAVELPGRRLALGTQWHPERGGGDALARLLVAVAAGAATCAA